MSSRSKEKLNNAVRKLFKSGGNSSDGGGGGGGGSAVSSDNEKSDPPEQNGGMKNVVDAAVPTESPGRRPKRHDNKVSPASARTGTVAAMMKVPQPDVASIRTRRLMKEYQEMQKIQSKKQPMFTVELVNDNLCEWYARLHMVDPDSKLARDMLEFNVPHILLHLVFPDNFPFAPPFMRVVKPQIERGFVMEGGAICMELLTPRGWASAYTVEAVLMQFSASVVKGHGRIVRKSKNTKEFTRRSAEETFRSVVKTHEKYGWVTPALSDG